VTPAVRLAVLRPDHRSDIESIVRSSGVFSEHEVEVALELFDEGVVDPARSAAAAAGRAAGALAPDYEFIGAFHEERLIGFACFGATPATDRTYDLYWIAVHQSARRTGAGAALMAWVEHELAGRRARLIVVETSSREDYAPTRQFYHKRGYLENARLRDFYAAGDDRVILTKRLVAAPAPASAGQ
jgi:GNAT superfamily N-acetyltransferase